MTQTVVNHKAVGQVPGQLYNGRVVDSKGAGLYAGFFYMDADGQPIMDDKFTDANGYFHFTVPDHNHENIFIQFYATDNYNPVVKTFAEIVANETIVLENKGSGNNGLLIAGAIAAGLLLLNKNKSIGQVIAPGNSKKPWYEQRIVHIGAAAVAVYLIFKYKPTQEQKQFLSEAKNRLDYLAKERGIVPSLTLAQFQTYATQITRAVDKCGTDMAAIERAFQGLNNEADFWQLCVTFGVSKYDGCFEGNLPSWNVHYTLPEALASDLSGSQLNRINNILSSRGIDVTF